MFILRLCLFSLLVLSAIPSIAQSSLPPIANFTCVCSGLDCLVDGSASFDQDESGVSIVNYEWDFGIGTGFQMPSSQPTAVFTYATADVFVVRLRVTDDEGTKALRTGTCITGAGTADPLAIADGVCRDRVAHFVGENSLGIGDEIITWEWDLSPGVDLNGNSILSGADQAAQNPSPITFPAATDYTVTLTVTDESLNQDTVTVPIACSNNVPDITVRNFALLAGDTLIDTEQIAFDDDLDAMLSVFLVNEPDFITLASTGSSIVHNQLQKALRYTLAPDTTDIGTVLLAACVTDGVILEPVCRDFEINVLPASVQRGDCNADTILDAADSSTLRAELFDNDGLAASNTLGGSVVGHPLGCDANGDAIVDAGDLACIQRLLIAEVC